MCLSFCLGSRLYLDSKALLAAEAYVFARYHMYKTVYFHKTTRAAEVMLRLLFQRYRTLLSGKSENEAAEVVPYAPKEVVRAFHGKPELKDFLKLDDHSVSQFCKACEESSDKSLQWLSVGLLHRQYLKAIDATGSRADTMMEFTREADEVLRNRGYEPESTSASDAAGDTPYKMYDPDSEAANTQIYVEGPDAKPVEIGSLSEPVAQLRKKFDLVRVYYPKDVRDEIQEIANRTLRR